MVIASAELILHCTIYMLSANFTAKLIGAKGDLVFCIVAWVDSIEMNNR